MTDKIDQTLSLSVNQTKKYKCENCDEMFRLKAALLNHRVDCKIRLWRRYNK